MADSETSAGRNAAMNIIQAALAELWQKARAAVARIEELREENGQLSTRVQELEHTLRTMESQLTQKEQRIEALEKHPPHHTAVEVGERLLYLTPDEREALERQIDDLLKRINTHLGSNPV
jgi:chromosome segregation ATPase